jgi:ABC-2 type transport system ATP-binding protein
VALALIADPQVVVLDEMTTGLDPAARRVAWNLVSAVRERGTTVILVTHFMDEAERLCDRLAVMVRGRLVADGTAAQLIRRHRPGQVVRFSTPPGTDLAFLHCVPGVDTVDPAPDGVRVGGTGPLLARVAHALVERGLEPPDLRPQVPTLEEAYLSLTGGSPDPVGQTPGAAP